MEATRILGVFIGIIEYILGFYWDNGNYYCGLHRDYMGIM